jgi:hypothetical protein
MPRRRGASRVDTAGRGPIPGNRRAVIKISPGTRRIFQRARSTHQQRMHASATLTSHVGARWYHHTGHYAPRTCWGSTAELEFKGYRVLLLGCFVGHPAGC